jgi:hypothetical protein
MSAANQVKEFLSAIPLGQPFHSSTLRQLASTENIRQILNRLVKAGELKRVARGVFVKPEYVSTVGEMLPSSQSIAETIAKSTGETIAIHGAEAARQLQLSTQTPMHLVFYTSGNTRTLKIANQTVRLKHVNPSRLMETGTMPALVLSALSYLGRENVTTETIEIIRSRISPKEFKATINLMEKMPAWMSDVFFRYQKRRKDEK